MELKTPWDFSPRLRAVFILGVTWRNVLESMRQSQVHFCALLSMLFSYKKSKGESKTMRVYIPHNLHSNSALKLFASHKDPRPRLNHVGSCDGRYFSTSKTTEHRMGGSSLSGAGDSLGIHSLSGRFGNHILDTRISCQHRTRVAYHCIFILKKLLSQISQGVADLIQAKA